jgi:hypothetical protein
MMRSTLIGLAAILPVVLPAQRVTTSVDVGGASMRYADTVSAAGPAITPSITAEWTRASLGATGTYARLGTGSSTQGLLTGSVFTPKAGVLLGELDGSTGGSYHEDGSRTGQTLAIGRLHAMGDAGGAWIGGGSGASWDGFAWRKIVETEAGAWARAGAGTFLVTVAPTAVADTIRYTDAQATAHWTFTAFEAGLTAGARGGQHVAAVGGTSRAWGSASLTAWVNPTVGIVASAGTYPVDFTQGFPGGRFATLSVRFSGGGLHPHADTRAMSVSSSPSSARQPTAADAHSGLSDFRIVTANGVASIALRAASAHLVEINADFTGWRPVAMSQSSAGAWSMPLVTSPGTHQVNVRVDGGPWQVPPGLTSMADEFGGAVGLLVVEYE